MFNICQVNLNSLKNKLFHVNTLLISNKIDILGITETWLTPQTGDSFLNINGYEIVRCDSSENTRKHGVAAYVNKSCKYVKVQCDLNNALVLHLLSFDVYLITIYRPPSYDDVDDAMLLNFLDTFCSDKEVFIQGDFNLSSIRWNAVDVLASYITPRHLNFYDLFASIGLTQINLQPTNFPSGNILDLCLVSHPERIGSCIVLPPLPNCSHCPVLTSYVFQSPQPPAASSGDSCRVWTKGKYNLIAEALQDVDWEAELLSLPADLQYARFLSIVRPFINNYVPLKKSVDDSFVPWCVNPPRALERECKLAWSHYKTTRSVNGRHHADTQTAWNSFTLCNDSIKRFAISSQINYEHSLSDQLKVNPKLFHSYIKHRRVDKPTVGPLRLENGELSDDPAVMAECFVSTFSSVFSASCSMNPSSHQVCNSTMGNFAITRSEVFKLLSEIDPNTGMGGDGMHARFLKMLSSELSLPLTIIFNTSLTSAILPAQWLNSIVVPIYKKSFRYEPLNYRPISLTSVPCKILERAIVKNITAYLEDNHILSPNQFGFRAGHSTVDQLLLTYNDITNMVDNGEVVDLLFFDYSKAFDTVCHRVLLQKLSCLGITGEVLNWIEVFLTSRSMKVKVSDCFSRPVSVTSGVPQGSVLGPLLFLIHINFAVSDLTCKFKIFADDIKIYFAFNSQDVANLQTCQGNIDRLINKSASWGLKMNQNKCVVMRFSPKNSTLSHSGTSPYKVNDVHIDFVESHSDLGVTVDRSLKYHCHIRRKVAMVGALTTNLLSCTLSRSPQFLMNVYTMHVRPLLEYGSPIWNMGYVTDIRLLERIQRRWTRAVDGLSDVCYDERLRRLDLFSVEGRLLRFDLIYMWKIFNGKSSIKIEDMFQLSPHTALRGHQFKVFTPRSRLDVRQRFFSVRTISRWNSLASSTVCADSLDKFKALLKVELGDALYKVS